MPDLSKLMIEQDIQVLTEDPTLCKVVEESTQQIDTTPYFKFGNPMYLQELDWGITLSKYEFPWQDIAVGL